MTTLPRISHMDATINFRGLSIPISYDYTADTDDSSLGWANGSVTIDGRSIAVGGGWIDEDGDVRHYDGADIGDLDGLSEAIGLDPDGEDYRDDRDELRAALIASLPATWPTEDGLTLAEDEGEFETLRVVRVAGHFYRVDANGGWRGAHGDGRGGLRRDNVEAIDEREAVRLMLECGLSPAEIERRLA